MTRHKNGDKKIAILIVAYNAEKKLIQTLERIPQNIISLVGEIVVFDDKSKDSTFQEVKKYKIFKKLDNLHIFQNTRNLGYGGNQKAGYNYVIKKGYDYVVLLHGDGQYAPESLPQLLEPALQEGAEVIFGSRMMSHRGALKGGMPLYKYVGNKILTAYENKMLKMNLSEFHSGYRVYSCKALSQIPYQLNTNDFHFDTEIIIQLKELGVKIKEIPIPTYYGDEICHVNGLKYAKNVALTVLNYVLHKWGFIYMKKYDIHPPFYQDKIGKYSSHQQIYGMIAQGSHVLDIGCGSGSISKLLAQKHCRIVGVDCVKPKNISYFVDFVVADLEKGLSLQNEKYSYFFDYIILADVIEHIKNSEKLINSIKPYLKKNGYVIASTGNIANWYIRLNLLLGTFNYTSQGILDRSHVHLYTQKSFLQFFQEHGFKIIEKKITIIPYELIFPQFKNTVFLKVISFFSYQLAQLWPSLFAYQLIVKVKIAENSIKKLL